MPDRRSGSKLVKGEERLEDWSSDADQIEQNAVYEALFAVTEGSAESQYPTREEDADDDEEILIYIRPELVVKVRCLGPRAFSIVYIGPPDDITQS